ncbi:MAG: hypothetical protein WC319_00890 [Candidatus Paceibacterota bacterium]|jgi:hypothetical protein
MENIQQRIIKGSNIFNRNLLLFLSICLISSLFSIYAIPFLTNKSITEQEINEGINQVSTTYGGTITFSAQEIIISLTSIFQFSIISLALIIVAYIVKYKIDKKIFRIKRWRDWKFFIYISGISFIIIDVSQKIALGIGNNLIINIVLTLLSCYLVILFSSILLPEELPEIKI